MPNRQRRAQREQANQQADAQSQVGGGQGNAEAQLQAQGQGGQTSMLDAAERQGPAAPYALAPAGTTLASFTAAYSTWLNGKVTEAGTVPRPALAARALLNITQVVSAMSASGQFADVSKLPSRPPAGPPRAGTYVPPALIPACRTLIEMASGPGGVVEDWNTALGVPQYRTQTDNLIGPEVTCGPTTLTMAMQRLGVSQADVVAAIERQLKIKQLKAEKKEVNDANIAAATLAPDAWQKAIASYLGTEEDRKGYQRPLDVNQGAQRQQAIGAEFKDNAQLEDLVDFLAELLRVDRDSITTEGADSMFAAVMPEGERPQTEQIWVGGSDWVNVKAQVKECLEGGGACTMSINHKGKNSGSHIVCIQQVTASGVILDDPYGQIGDDYADKKGSWGDAYDRGSRDERRNDATDKTDANDWKASAARNLEAGERLGESSVLKDSQLDTPGFVRYVQLFRRANPSLAPESSPRPRARPAGLGQ